MEDEIVLWAIFGLFIMIMLGISIVVAKKEAAEQREREELIRQMKELRDNQRKSREKVN